MRDSQWSCAQKRLTRVLADHYRPRPQLSLELVAGGSREELAGALAAPALERMLLHSGERLARARSVRSGLRHPARLQPPPGSVLARLAALTSDGGEPEPAAIENARSYLAATT